MKPNTKHLISNTRNPPKQLFIFKESINKPSILSQLSSCTPTSTNNRKHSNTYSRNSRNNQKSTQSIKEDTVIVRKVANIFKNICEDSAPCYFPPQIKSTKYTNEPIKIDKIPTACNVTINKFYNFNDCSIAANKVVTIKLSELKKSPPNDADDCNVIDNDDQHHVKFAWG